MYLISFFGVFFFSFASYSQRNNSGLNPSKSTTSGGTNFVESCGNTWLNITNYNGGVRVGDLDVTGNKITIEARFNRTIPYTRGRLYAGDIVSKHKDVTNTNYLLRPNSAEITTTDGYYITPLICEIDTNKTYHIAMVYDGKILKFYRNGFLMSQVAATGNLIQNNFLTTIGDLAYQPGFGQESLIGYIDEVRIWNVARTENEIKTYLSKSLPNPTTQNGLLAYYTFDDLKNKQGNSSWDGSIFGNAVHGTSNLSCASYVADSCDQIVANTNTLTADFSLPDSVCLNTPININNLTKGGTNFYWNFNVADINSNPEGTNLGNIGGLFSLPVFTDQVYVNGNYYVFVVNNYPGGLIRLDFGNSLLNTPTYVNLGDVGGIIPYNAEGIQVVQSNGKWYALIVGGYPAGGVPSRIIKIDFGTSITNTFPVGTNWGNIGNLNYPIDLHVFQENNNWYGFTVNSENNTITRFNFGQNFDNSPTAVNLGNVGGSLNYPTGIYAINNNGYWSVFVTNGSDNSSITRLDFGTSLLGNPTAVNLGNISNTLYRPRDIYIMKFCGELIGFVVNGLETKNDIVRLDFNNNLLSTPTAVSLGNIGDLYFPHSLSQIFRVGADLYTMITNVRNNTITRLRFKGSLNSSIPNSSDSIPPTITYDSAGIYNVHLMVDEGLPTQTSVCKSIVVKDCFTQNIITADFSIPDTVCVNTPINIKNLTEGGTNFYWNFCEAGLNQTPGAANLGNVGSLLNTPVFMDMAKNDDGNYYAFSVNYNPGKLIRYNFGNSLLNTPIVQDLGNFSGSIPNGAEGVQIVKANGSWYVILVGGGNVFSNSSPRVVTIKFGNSLANTGAATNWGNIGNLSQPLDLHVFEENNNWYGFTVNGDNNTITRFNFSIDLDNAPTAVNLGNVGNLSYPTGIYAINDNGTWRVFITNGGNNSRTNGTFSLSRLDFGNSLLNTPTGINLGNPANFLKHPRDLTIMKFCGEIIGFSVNGLIGSDDIVKMDFHNDLASIPTLTSMGNIGGFNFPHSISKIFREDADLYAFVTNAGNSTLSRLKFNGCNNSSLPNSADSIPLQITYDSAGVYNIHLTVDEGLPTQTSICKSIVVKDCFVSCNIQTEYSFSIDSCDVKQVHFKNETTNTDSITWIFSDGIISHAPEPIHNFTNYGNYSVKLIVTNNTGCTDSTTKNINIQLLQDNIILTNDTSICAGSNLQLDAADAFSYCWSPVTGLSKPGIKNPVANITQPITYHLTSQSYGTNLIINSDFSQGNTGFTSSYTYSSSGLPPAVYFIGKNPVSWNPGMTPCTDHTSGSGNMMLVNGSEQENIIVWSQTVKVTPNTNYAFSTWLETITTVNPAQLQFSINGIPIGNIFKADNNNCIWHRFYTLWNSGSDTSAVISIINKNINFNGNDFALDDISFAELLIKQDSVKVTLSQPPFVNLGPDTSTCRFDSVLLNAGNPGATYLWQDGTAGQTYLAKDSGWYYVKVTNPEGCSAKDSVRINNFAAINLKVSNDTTLCVGSQVSLLANGNNIQTYSWSPPATLSNPSIQSPVASPFDTTLYAVNVTDINGCKQSDSVKVNVAPLPTVLTLKDTSLCAGTNIILSTSATMGVNYSWSPSGGLSNSNAASPTASPSATTQYVVTVKTQANCKSSDTVNVVVNPLPSVAVGTLQSLICIGDSTSISATSPTAVSYTWTPAIGLNNPYVSTPTATPTATTNYHVQVADVNGCTSQDSVLVTIKQKPVFAIDPPNAGICTGESVTLTASGGDEYAWYPPTSLSNPNAAVTIASPTTSITYQVAITDNICAVSDTLSTTVNITELTTIDVTKSNDVDCILGTTTLRATGGVIYNWHPATYLSDSSIASPTAAPLETTVYHVQVTNATGCTGTDSITVYVYKGEVANGYKLPSAFTPNNDGNNDCFGVRKWGTLSNLDFSVYDRWGVLLFHTKNPSDCWNGTYNGKPQPPGTYVYQIRAQALCGSVYRKGTVVLIR